MEVKFVSEKGESLTELQKKEILRMNNKESNQLTRECLQLALIHLMAEQPYEKITVSEIVRRAGVSRTAFYRNYTDKEDFSKVVTLKDIEAKDWNLSPNRYIDYHKEEVRPYAEVLQEFKDALLAVQKAEAEFRSIINS